MFYNYGFDINFDKKRSKPFGIENGWVIIDAPVYEKIVNTVQAAKNPTSNYFKNGDKLYLTSDVKPIYPEFKIENYCNQMSISVKTEDDINKANVIVADIENSLSPILTSSSSKCYLYPVKDLVDLIDEATLNAHSVDIEKDFIILAADSLKTYKKYFDESKAILSEIYYNYIFSREEIKESYDNFEPLQAVLNAVNNGKQIVSYNNFTIELHKDGVVVDDDMFENLHKMFESPDSENKVLAVNIISDAERVSSLGNLILLYYKYRSNFSSKSEVNINEFTCYINNVLDYELTDNSVKVKCQELKMDMKRVANFLK
jgi:hypothetical protein